MGIRMLPVAVVFRRFPRLVRDISRKLGKSVDLRIEGETTEADKGVIEALADPLLHLMRNSLDHGIEPPEERRAAGKPETARLVLRATQEGDKVVLQIEDDGRGIDPGKIRASALRKGLISPETAAGLSETEAVNLIFLPGFSTAETVSDLSGRGVGMDAVRHTIEGLGGTVRLSSVVGLGTTVDLHLPLTAETVRMPAAAIRAAVSKALLALQAGDAMRQGLEHADLVFRAACDPRIGAALRAAVLDLGGQQAAAAIERHRPHLHQLERELAEATARTEDFLHEVEDLFRPGRTGIKDLLDAYARIDGILDEGAGLQSALGEEARALSISVDTVQDIVHDIGAIEMRVNLIGINAVIACAGLGPDGLPLKVIAHQLRELVEESGGRVADLTSHLDAIRNSSRAVAELFERQSTEMQVIRDELETKVASGLAALRGSLAATRAAISDNQRLLAETLSEGLRAMTEHRDEIGRMAEALKAAVPETAAPTALHVSPQESDILAELRSLLSIEAERVVHDAWLARIGQEVRQDDIAPATGTTGLDIVLF